MTLDPAAEKLIYGQLRQYILGTDHVSLVSLIYKYCKM